jgi:polar amino acid transport system substrate-binding protein
MNREQNNILLIILSVLAALVAGLMLYLFFRPDSGGGSGGVSTPVPGGDDSWTSVQRAGVIVVGTSLDYPPFTYKNAQFQPDGFDIALMRAVAGRLGVQPDFRDMAFDGLGGALVLGQIDSAIAAISVTPEREEQVDFSNIYYVSEDGILARQDSPINSVQSAADMRGLRIGVERGTVYETWLQTNLVDTGLTASNNIFAYERIDDAVRDLREERVDLVMMDLPVAQQYLSQGGLKLVGQGLNQQRFAIALQQGATALQIQINNALTQLQNEGVIAALAQQYLGVDPNQIIPPPTPTATPVVPPTATPVPNVPPTAVPCVNGLRYIADLNLDDNNMTTPPPMAPGQPFRKGWRVQNTGTCSWNLGYRLVYVSGNTPQSQMGGQPTPVQVVVAPGQQYDIWVDLVAPLQAGTYQGIWQMTDDRGQPFGDRVWVGIRVLPPATATPPPTQTPSPFISFTANPTTIVAGQCTTFNWYAQGVLATYFYRQGEAWQNNQVPPQGSRVECPASTTNYFLRVVRTDNMTEERVQTITVQPALNAPVINQFAVNPTQLTLGQCTTIQWQVTGNVSRVTLLANGVSLWDGAPLSGNLQNCPSSLGTVEYSIQASGPGGNSQAREYVNVVGPSTATPVPTAVPDAPRIDSFAVVPSTVALNQCVTINWSTSGGTSAVQLKRNGSVVLDNAGLSGSAQDCLPVTGAVVYRLEARNAAGQVDIREQIVTVTENPQPTPPPNPLAGQKLFAIAINGVSTQSGTVIDATFSGEGIVSGNSGCNTYSANYTAGSNGTFSATNLQNSTRECQPSSIMEQEQAYWNALRSATSFEQSGSTTIFRNSVGSEVLRFVR